LVRRYSNRIIDISFLDMIKETFLEAQDTDIKAE